MDAWEDPEDGQDEDAVTPEHCLLCRRPLALFEHTICEDCEEKQSANREMRSDR